MSKFTAERFEEIKRLARADWEERNGRKWPKGHKNNEEVDCYSFEIEDRSSDDDDEYDDR